MKEIPFETRADALRLVKALYLHSFVKRSFGIHAALVDVLFDSHIRWVEGGRKGHPPAYVYEAILSQIRGRQASLMAKPRRGSTKATIPDDDNVSDAIKRMGRLLARLENPMHLPLDELVLSVSLHGPRVNSSGHKATCTVHRRLGASVPMYGLCDEAPMVPPATTLAPDAAERAFLGRVLILQEVPLRNTPFREPHHQSIYNALVAMAEAGREIDILTLRDELKRRGDAVPIAVVTGLVDNMSHSFGAE